MAGEARLTVLYDGRCRVCTRLAARLAGLDAGQRLRFVPLQRATRDRPEVQRLRAQRDLRRELHVIDVDGRWASGGEAVLRTLELVPRLRPLARAARLPGVAALVEPAYRLVAQHRAHLAWLAGDFPLGIASSVPRSAAARQSDPRGGPPPWARGRA